MAKGDTYLEITRYLEKQNSSILVMSFDEIKKINGDYLPASAYKHLAWWSNSKSHSQAFGWLNAGYKTCNVDIALKKVTFEKM